MTVVTFPDLRPPARFYTETPWTQARVEEAETLNGPWEEVETVTLDPVEVDPSSPGFQSIMTTLGTVEHGYYRVVWVDADDNEVVTDAILWPRIADPRPTVEDVSALLRARTNVGGTERGVFDDDTRPSQEQVETLIDFAMGDLRGRIGDHIPAEHAGTARRLAALQAATLIEASFFPNELERDTSAYRQYQAMYLNGITALGMVGRTAAGVSPYVYVT